MRLADRITLAVFAAFYGAWLRSPTRRAVRSILRWRTAYLLEQLDADVRTLRRMRATQIPLAIEALTCERHALLQQWREVADGAQPPCAPDTYQLPHPAAVSPGSSTEFALPGRLYTQRTSHQ